MSIKMDTRVRFCAALWSSFLGSDSVSVDGTRDVRDGVRGEWIGDFGERVLATLVLPGAIRGERDHFRSMVTAGGVWRGDGGFWRGDDGELKGVLGVERCDRRELLSEKDFWSVTGDVWSRNFIEGGCWRRWTRCATRVAL